MNEPDLDALVASVEETKRNLVRDDKMLLDKYGSGVHDLQGKLNALDRVIESLKKGI